MARVASGAALVALVALLAPPGALAMPSNTADSTWGVNGRVSAIVQVGDTVYVGGTFTQAAENGGAGPVSLPRSNIAAFDATTGALRATWDPNVNGEVRALAASADGNRIYAGGSFSTVDAIGRSNLVALNAVTGEVDPLWNAGASGGVNALAVWGNRLYIGGGFGKVAGVSRTNLAAVDTASAAVDTLWKPTANGVVRTLALSPDGVRVYAGGDFSAVSSATRRNLAAIDRATGALVNWQPNPGYRIFGVVANSTTAYTAGGGSANALAAWNAATGARNWVKRSDGDFQAIGLSGPVVYAGGHFLYYDGHSAPRRIVAVDGNTGNLRPDWTPALNGSMGVWAISVRGGTRLAIGGDFTLVSGQTRQHYAQFTGQIDGPPDVSAPTTPTNVVALPVGGSKVDLTWTASGDDVGVSGYTVFRDGVAIGTAARAGYTDETAQPNTTYSYTVQAFDSADHLSPVSSPARATTGPPDDVYTFTPTADAYIHSGSPAKNFGTATTLAVDGSPLEDTLLKFAVSGIADRQVVSAKLRMYSVDTSNDGGHVHRVADSSWSENTVTWNSAPSEDADEVADFSDVAPNTWYQADVTPLVADDGSLSMRIDSGSPDGASYSSKEATGGRAPQLIVRVATAPTQPTPPFSDDFETGDLGQWTSATGLTIQQQEKFSGAYGARATTTGTPAYARRQFTGTASELYYQLRFKLLSQGANSVVLGRLYTATGGSLVRVFLTSTGKLAYRNDVAGTTATATATPAAGAWHTVELHARVDGANGLAELRLDGNKVLANPENLGTSPIGRLDLGDTATARTFDVAFDDVAADTTPIPDTTPPTAPTGLTATATSASAVKLDWASATDDTGVAEYEIYRDDVLVGTVGATGTTFTDTTVSPATTYEYTVQAEDAAGNHSPSSDPVSVTTPGSDGAPPSAPTDLAATAVSSDRVDLSWSSATDDVGVSSYQISRDGAPVGTVDGATTSYRDTTVSASTDYTYTVTASDAAGNVSPASDAATVRTPPPALFRDGFESGDMSQWTSATGIVAQQDEVSSGAWSARAASSGAATYASEQLSATQTEVYYQLGFKVVSQGANSVILGRLRTAGGTSLVKVYLTSAGKLAYRNDVAGVASTSTTTVTPGAWHTLVLHGLVNGTTGLVELSLDGNKLLAKTENLGSTPVGRLELGDDATGRSYDIVFDDIVADRSPP
jgi:chitodextrinase